MKPSEAINEIYINLRHIKGGNKSHDKIEAVIRFLDKVAEREHERIAEFKKNIKPMD